MSDEELRAEWLAIGGEFHGPITETATIPEAKLFAFMRRLIESKDCAWENNGILERARQKQEATIADLRERHDAFVREVKGVLRDIAQPRDCGCVPCRGQCTSQPALLIETEEMRDLSTTAIALCDAELKGEAQ